MCPGQVVARDLALPKRAPVRNGWLCQRESRLEHRDGSRLRRGDRPASFYKTVHIFLFFYCPQPCGPCPLPLLEGFLRASCFLLKLQSAPNMDVLQSSLLSGTESVAEAGGVDCIWHCSRSVPEPQRKFISWMDFFFFFLVKKKKQKKPKTLHCWNL